MKHQPTLAGALALALLLAAPVRAQEQAQETAAEPAQEPSADTAALPQPDAVQATPAPEADAAPASVEATTATIAVEPLRKDAPAAPQQGSGEVTQLDEVVVTATKRATSVREIPATITALSGEDLERQGVQGIDQIVSLVPGVNLTDDGQGQAKRVTIRGISADVNVNFTVGTLFGDIPFSDPFIPKVQLDPNPFDMATVEVLKGPQGTLFGGSGLNGMLRYVPETPQFNQTQVKYFAQYDSYPGNGGVSGSYGAVFNAPLGDSVAVRVMGFHRGSPGFVDDLQSGRQDVNRLSQYGYRAMLGWLPGNDWKVNLMVVGQHTLQDDVAFTNNGDGQLERSVTPRPSPVETEYQLANLGLEYSLGWADFISQTSGVQKKYHSFLDTSRLLLKGAVPLLAAVGYNKSTSFVQEFRLVSTEQPDNPWKWLAGLFYYHLDLFDCSDVPTTVPELLGIPVLPGLLAQPCTQNLDYAANQIEVAHLAGDLTLGEKAAFGEVTRKLGERWELTLGARLYQTESEGTVTTAGALYSVQTGGSVKVNPGDVKEKGVSPKASLSFHATDDVLTYLSASRGFRFGGIQLGSSTPTTNVPPVFKSDTLWNYELGLRSQWFERTLFADASLYYIDWKNPQVYQQSRDKLASFIDNVGRAKGRGAEVSTRWLVPFLNGLSLSASASYNETVTAEPFKSSSGKNVTSGSPWPLSPRWQTSTTLAYALPFDTWKASTAVRHTYSAKACNTIDCTAMVFGYQTVDLQFALSSLTLQWLPEISMSLNNLTDKRGFSNITTDGPGSVETYNYIPPRALVLRLSGNF